MLSTDMSNPAWPCITPETMRRDGQLGVTLADVPLEILPEGSARDAIRARMQGTIPSAMRAHIATNFSSKRNQGIEIWYPSDPDTDSRFAPLDFLAFVAAGMPERAAWDAAWDQTLTLPFSNTRSIVIQDGVEHRLMVSSDLTTLQRTYRVTITTDSLSGGMFAVHEYDLGGIFAVMEYLRNEGYPVSHWSEWRPYNASMWSSMMHDQRVQAEYEQLPTGADENSEHMLTELALCSFMPKTPKQLAIAKRLIELGRVEESAPGEYQLSASARNR